MPQLFTGSPCARFCGADMGHLHNLVLALGDKAVSRKLEFRAQTATLGGGVAPQAGGLASGLRRRDEWGLAK